MIYMCLIEKTFSTNKMRKTLFIQKLLYATVKICNSNNEIKVILFFFFVKSFLEKPTCEKLLKECFVFPF